MDISHVAAIELLVRRLAVVAWCSPFAHSAVNLVVNRAARRVGNVCTETGGGSKQQQNVRVDGQPNVRDGRLRFASKPPMSHVYQARHTRFIFLLSGTPATSCGPTIRCAVRRPLPSENLSTVSSCIYVVLCDTNYTCPREKSRFNP